MAKRKKQNSKVIMEQKRRKRKLLTLWRIIKYGANSFRRNAWLSVAATAVMTITLLIIFGSFLVRMGIVNTVNTLTEKIDVSIYLKKDVKDTDVAKMTKTLKNLKTVKKVEYTSNEQAQKNYASKKIKEKDETTLEAIEVASNEFPASFSVTLEDIGNTAELKKTVESDKIFQENLHKTKEPTYKSSRKESIETISNAFATVEKVGVFAIALFAMISGLIIFNTIRMAIFNRREEIYMMKLVGAENSFIRGPFVVESMISGILAAVFATSVGYTAVTLSLNKIENWGITLDSVVTRWPNYLFIVFPCLALLGSLIGIVSSWIATRKYLNKR